jgi:hypothetical protein
MVIGDDVVLVLVFIYQLVTCIGNFYFYLINYLFIYLFFYFFIFKKYKNTFAALEFCF